MSKTFTSREFSIDELWELYLSNRNTESRNLLVLRYIFLVRSAIQKLNLPKYSMFSKDDLVNTGIIGLIEAIDKFDPSIGAKFEYFAYQKIRGKILDELRKIDWISRDARQKAQNLQYAISTIHSESGEKPTYMEVLEKMNITEEEFKKFVLAYESYRLSFFVGEGQILNVDGEEIPILENYPDVESIEPLDKLIEEEKIKIIANFLESLPERNRLIMILYYYENLKFREIAQILEISESRVSQIHSQTISLLKKKFQELEE